MKRGRPFKWRQFGRDLRRQRKTYGCSLREAGTDTGVNYSTMGRAERGMAMDAPGFIRLCDWAELDPFDYQRKK